MLADRGRRVTSFLFSTGGRPKSALCTLKKHHLLQRSSPRHHRHQVHYCNTMRVSSLLPLQSDALPKRLDRKRLSLATPSPSSTKGENANHRLGRAAHATPPSTEVVELESEQDQVLQQPLSTNSSTAAAVVVLGGVLKPSERVQEEEKQEEDFNTGKEGMVSTMAGSIVSGVKKAAPSTVRVVERRDDGGLHIDGQGLLNLVCHVQRLYGVDLLLYSRAPCSEQPSDSGVIMPACNTHIMSWAGVPSLIPGYTSQHASLRSSRDTRRSSSIWAPWSYLLFTPHWRSPHPSGYRVLQYWLLYLTLLVVIAAALCNRHDCRLHVVLTLLPSTLAGRAASQEYHRPAVLILIDTPLVFPIEMYLRYLLLSCTSAVRPLAAALKFKRVPSTKRLLLHLQYNSRAPTPLPPSSSALPLVHTSPGLLLLLRGWRLRKILVLQELSLVGNTEHWIQIQVLYYKKCHVYF